VTPKTAKKTIGVLCDFTFWGADDLPAKSAPDHAAKVNALYAAGHQIVLISRRLNHPGPARGFRADVAALGVEYTEFHDLSGFPRLDELYVGGRTIKETA
jgi:hypothetical protein